MKLITWLRNKIEQRKIQKTDHDPWWVTLMMDVGRPVVAVFVLVMCAPGEHYIGEMAGWSNGLAWLTPATLTAYAGIAAVVATQRRKGSPGRWTAILGAVVSILLAMAAQPIAHLYELHEITGHRFALSIVVSCIPAAVFGHLMHMGAAGRSRVRTDTVPRAVAAMDAGQSDMSERTDTVTVFDLGQNTVTVVPDPDWRGGRPVPVVSDDTDVPPPVSEDIEWTRADNMSRIRDAFTEEEHQAGHDVPSRTYAAGVPMTADVSAPVRVRRTADGSMTSVVRDILSGDPGASDDELRDTLRDRFGQDSKTNSMNRAIKRAREAMSA